MELNCRVRNSQESIKDILKRQVLNLKRYDLYENYNDFDIIEFPDGDYLNRNDVLGLFN